MWQETSSQLLRALRGGRSQRAFSMRLGYLGNPVKDWEAGRRFPTASVTLQAARRVGVNVEQAIGKFQSSSAGLEGTGDDHVAAWLNTLRGRRTFVDIAQGGGLSRQRVGRWLNGKSRPRLPDFLHLIDVMTGRVSDFVAELVDINKVPVLLDAHQKRCAAKELAYVAPWTEAIMRVLETHAYQDLPKHQPGWIAERLGISPSDEQDCIDKLLAAGSADFDGKRIRPSETQTVNTATDPQKAKLLKQHWGEVVLDRAESSQGWTAYNVMSLSREDMAKVEAILKRAYAEIRSTVANSHPEETVGLVHLNVLNWRI